SDTQVSSDQNQLANITEVANIIPTSSNTYTEAEVDESITSVMYEEVSYDFGKMKVTDDFSHRFILKNTGKVDLIITEVKPSCSCTASEWTKTSIAPGETGFVMAKFNPKPNYTGFFTKTVSVKTNTDPKIKVLKFRGEIVN
ncbi:MAG TPA: DUF1573 domain-containing protein, partial [Bacteroidetes bacterium]|nr:DUF1573 domain-containing protein [Bacteroidota bacterium]